MKKIFMKAHHFTRRELLAEEIILVLLACIIVKLAFAASALLPVKANLVQCGSRENLPQACREDLRCCTLLEQLGGGRDIQPDKNSLIIDEEAINLPGDTPERGFEHRQQRLFE